MRLRRAAAIGIGALIGGAVRWLAVTGLDVDPYLALLFVNTAACGLLGWVQAQFRGGRRPDTDATDLLGIGLCGTLSTWSALAVELSDDLRRGAVAAAIAWGALSVAAGIAAAIGGIALSGGSGGRSRRDGAPRRAGP